MKLQHAGWLVIKVLAGVLSAIVSLHALYAAIVVDFRFNPVLTVLYCLFPALSFPVYLLVRSARAEALTQIVLFVGFLVTASMLGWRNCSAMGYCTTVSATVFTVLRFKFVLASLGVAAFTFVAWLIAEPRNRAAA